MRFACDYAVSNGEKAGTSKWFSQTLARLGYEPVKHTPGQNGKRGFKGIGVRLETPKDRTGSEQTDYTQTAHAGMGAAGYPNNTSRNTEWSTRL